MKESFRRRLLNWTSPLGIAPSDKSALTRTFKDAFRIKRTRYKVPGVPFYVTFCILATHRIAGLQFVHRVGESDSFNPKKKLDRSVCPC
jgi:hypothetical protein